MHLLVSYILLFLGIFFEGELILLSAVIAAHQGLLNIWMVILIAIFSTILSDIIYFNVGKYKAKKWLTNSKYAAKYEVVQQKLLKNRTKMLLSYRFLYGMRIITPIVLGSQEISISKFLKYSILSTIIWCFVIVGLGYVFGELIINNLKHIEKIEYYFIGSLIAITVGFLIFKMVKRKE
ncbi:DedA family protein [Polaribacter glomeratus]|uniref:VTT domain-containing protein n=1 Tax=Polaribacter glomeratus TaxID=102 RepID=A0A2S7WWA9_9FLAO|nr:DedA family protein [Polaribacter glomeratus]PQJ81889.1 hypothetical protein BTO16_04580 [Polaribacter glomeratus]TXD64377.1 DedA family protein [Polaribacter glomeratus]